MFLAMKIFQAWQHMKLIENWVRKYLFLNNTL